MRPVTEPDPLRQLVEAAREGDDVALGQLVRRTQAEVWRLCSALGSPGEVEDLVQDTYLRAMRAIPGFRGDAPVRLWLLAIARRACADHVRQRERRRQLARKLVSTHVEEAHRPGDPVTDILRSIDPDRREAFVLTQLLGLAYEEAAAVLDCPVGTIRSRVARARADLLEQVAQAEAR